MNQNIYPYSIQVNNLPVFLFGIGGSEYQYHIQRPEGYEHAQILYSANGRGTLKYDNISVDIGSNTYFFLPANYPHEYFPVGGNWEVRWISFRGSACPDILKELGLVTPFARKLHNDNTLQHLFNQIFVTLKSDKIYSNYTCAGLVYQYILEFYKLVSDSSKTGGSDRSEILMPVLDYIDDNYYKDFPLTVLSELAGISPQHLCRIFREVFNMTPMEYLTCKRIREAKQLLINSSLNASEVGNSVGFFNPSYFSSVFRKYERISPIEYRHKYKNK